MAHCFLTNKHCHQNVNKTIFQCGFDGVKMIFWGCHLLLCWLLTGLCTGKRFKPSELNVGYTVINSNVVADLKTPCFSYSPASGIYPTNFAQLTHISLVSFLWDIGKQSSPKCDAAKRGIPSGAILFACINFIEKWNKHEKILLMPLKLKMDSSKW